MLPRHLTKYPLLDKLRQKQEMNYEATHSYRICFWHQETQTKD